MSKWLQWLGHDDKDISRLNIIHVAGTKGKGSTCAFAESFLRAHGQRTGFPQKTGMYTSPHLLSPEERIRINFQPISRDLLTKYFFEVYETLKEKSPPEEFGRVPRYLQLWALVSFHTFLRERIDVAIVETHHGGEYDATNFIQHPAATVIAKLGMDHIAQLGPTIENIAWHKAGIFKPGAPAFSTFQAPSLAKVLETRAREKGVQLKFVSDETDLPDDTLKLTSHVQRQNAALALAAVESVLDRRGLKLTRDDVEVGAQQFSWPGRFQIINDDAQKWFLDGAHNDISVREAARWFADAHILLSREHNPALRVLIWSQISDQRESLEVLEILARTLKEYNVPIQHVIFSTYNEHEGSGKYIVQMLIMQDRGINW
ncbi:folylpolyglutamate synthase [Patellaria atrata CBS 101060]|uniref:tetrahydrofolate synthase n=1 Tax=Patellaria atrata CBS 101060 TaxID=1346257 RepID=A0A9P4VR34_9PEZI|nr:folylpolyglutamate synthase [Patellaria atrata CBS 101060]